MEQLILQCEDSIEGILTAIYDAFVYKKRMGAAYKDSISIRIGDGGNFVLFAQVVEVPTIQEKAYKTMQTIEQRLGRYVSDKLLHALCNFDADRGTVVLGYLVKAFAVGPQISEHLADPYVMRVLELARKAENESHLFNGFVRFKDVGKFLYATIEPRCDVLPMIMEHFADRYPNEHFVIYDSKRKYALVHPAGQSCYFMKGQDLNLITEGQEDSYELLWKQYFNTIAIKERKNERCQNNMIPKWYRKTMLEFT